MKNFFEMMAISLMLTLLTITIISLVYGLLIKTS